MPHKPKTVCTELPENYNLGTGRTSALSHSKVLSTWDEEPDLDRAKFMNKRHTEKELAEMDLTAYLASRAVLMTRGSG